MMNMIMIMIIIMMIMFIIIIVIVIVIIIIIILSLSLSLSLSLLSLILLSLHYYHKIILQFILLIIMIKPHLVNFITEISLPLTPKSRTSAVANHTLYKSLHGFRGHVMRRKLLWRHNDNSVTTFTQKHACKFPWITTITVTCKYVVYMCFKIM